MGAAVVPGGNQWTNMWQQGLGQNPPFNALPIRPFAAHDGGNPAHFLSGGFLDKPVYIETG
jgi:hypothetical protein